MPGQSAGVGTGGRYRSILVSLDGSSLSEQALPLAVAIAERAKASLRLVLVSQLPVVPLSPAGRPLYASLEREARQSETAYLKAFGDQLKQRSSSLAITSAILAGPVADTLREHIRERGIDLVVMTSRGQGGLRRLWLGSVADALVRGSAVPVLLVRPEEHPSPRPVLENLSRILVPVDGSALSEAILDPARELAALAGAELMLVQVVQPLASPLEGHGAAPLRFDVELTTLRRKEAADYLSHLAERCAAAGVRTAHAATLGTNVADAILGLAESATIGCVAMATHGRGGVKRLALGSVADKVVRTAHCPILVYRPPRGTRSR
jgi:nucleotide-binding universal stress UspA family protein